jgi:hypothetical protein
VLPLKSCPNILPTINMASVNKVIVKLIGSGILLLSSRLGYIARNASQMETANRVINKAPKNKSIKPEQPSSSKLMCK